MSEVLVFAELVDGKITDLSLQCLSAGKRLGDALGARLACVLVGSGLGELPSELISRGADTVYTADDPALEHYLTGPYRKVVEGLFRERSPKCMLLPASTIGNDLAPAVAARVGAGCVVDCQGIRMHQDAPVFLRYEFERRVLAAWQGCENRPVLATLKDGAAAAAVADPTRRGEVQALALPAGDLAGGSRVVRRDVARKTVNLKDAHVIVTGGAGVGNRENFKLIEDLAAALKGELGATRAAVDAGWISAERQIGQTGVTVRPEVYFACGVSGAVQHRVGMMDSKKIVAINSDPLAPIFRFAHYRLTGDLKAIIPRLLSLLK